MARTHKCPGCDRTDIPRALLACRPCWWRLPLDLRNRINAAHQAGPPIDHLRAVGEAARWYRDNPK